MIVCTSCGVEFEPALPEQKICDACDALANPVAPTAALRKIGTYALAHELGVGRYANSWLAEPAAGGGVILKLLRAYAPDAETVQRFLEEAKKLGASGKLEHAALARVLDAGVHLGGSLFLVYESGGETTLADELRGRGRVVAQRAIELCAQVAEGLHALHKAGFAHYDLKPANVGITREEDGREQAVVLDSVTGHLLLHAGLRETGMLPIATAAYLAPELALGRATDGRADLYALAVMLYQLLSGRLPITGHTADELIESHRSQRPLRLRDVGRRVHGDLEALLQRALSKDPGERFPDGASLAAALRRVAPIAEQATDDLADEDVEDPLQVTVAEPLEPEVAPPPKPRPEAPEAQPAQRPSPRPAPRTTRPPPESRSTAATPAPKRLFTPMRIAGVALVAVAIAGVAFTQLGGSSERPRRRRPSAPAAVASAQPEPAAQRPSPPAEPPAQPAPPEPSPAPAAIAAPAAAPAAPAAPPAEARARAAPAAHAPAASLEPTPAAEAAPLDPAAAPRPSSAPQKRVASAGSNPNRALLTDAQKQLGREQAKPAMRSLFALLARPDLSNDDRARATRMMAEAETMAGNKPAAVDWYRKYLRLTDDSAERARVVGKIRALNQ